MELMDNHVVAWDKFRKRKDGWKINESVWDWLLRKTDINPTKANIKRLADEMFIGEATLHRLKKTGQHSINRENLRIQLSKYRIKIPGVDDYSLGYYGYPPGTKYVDQHSSKLSKEQRKVNKRIESDLQEIFDIADDAKSICYFCQLANKQPLRTDCVSIFLSTHRDKQYGPASISKGKGFELGLTLCEECMNFSREMLLAPVSCLIPKILKKYKLKQPQLAAELGVNQAVISRLIHAKEVFIKPELLKKLYRLYRIGPDTYHRHKHWKLLLIIADFIAGKFDEEEMIDRMGGFCSPGYLPWEEEHPSFLEDCDLIEYDPNNDPNDFDNKPFNYSEDITLTILDTESDEIYFDSNEIFYRFKVKYEYHKECISGYPYFESANSFYESVIIFDYVLVNVKKRLTDEFISYEP
ncbi:helix-turn-helix domain-containing protein [Idiomarina abyssalis]|uniref:helix-turn-helix domain-containing protein n=1 Tax=Idiomarina abyssalis TaxID=86102 RepID=UPI0006C884D7|nr:helix-turn-helix transcriptional regulator [Idiomarina abyssalis]KPD21922.1 hypothetical protein ADS78_05580 [Idiomarina abyssalis]SFT65788.1 hypothetical protein SAMN04515657_1550 [Idiomarina abyssalis]